MAPTDVAVRELPRLSQRSVLALTAMRQIEAELAGEADPVAVCRLVTSALAIITLADLVIVSAAETSSGPGQAVAMSANLGRPINPQAIDVSLAQPRVLTLPPGGLLQLDLEVPGHQLEAATLTGLRELGIVRIIIMPLIRQGRYLGRVDLWFRRPISRGPVESDLCQQLVGQAATALTLARLAEATVLARQATLVRQVVEALHQAQPEGPDELLQAMVDVLPAALGCDRCYAYVWRPALGEFLPVAVAGMAETEVATLKRHPMDPREVPLFEQLLYATQPVVLGDVRRSTMLPAALSEGLSIEALLAVPVRDRRRELLTVIILDYTTAGRSFTAAQLSLVGHTLEQLAPTIESAIRVDELSRRNDRLMVLNEIGVQLSMETDLPELFPTLQARLASAIDASALFCGLVDAKGRNLTVYHLVDGAFGIDYDVEPAANPLLQQVYNEEQPVLVRAGAANLLEGLGRTSQTLTHAESIMAVPLLVAGQKMVGVLAIYSAYEHAYSEADLDLLQTVASQIAVASDQARLVSELQTTVELRGQLLDRLISERELERKSIVDDIHDNNLQALVSSMYKIDLILRLSEPENHRRWLEELRSVRTNLATNVDDLRALIFRIRPSTLDYLGLLPTLDEFLITMEREVGIKATVRSRLGSRLNSGMETLIYRLLQELLTNVRHHSRAKHVKVLLTRIEIGIEVIVEDDGIGFVPEAVTDLNQPGQGIGLTTVSEQVAVVGGLFDIQSQPGAGTQVRIVLPETAAKHITGSLDERRGARNTTAGA